MVKPITVVELVQKVTSQSTFLGFEGKLAKHTVSMIADLDTLNLDKVGYGGFVLGSRQFLLLPQLPQK